MEPKEESNGINPQVLLTFRRSLTLTSQTGSQVAFDEGRTYSVQLDMAEDAVIEGVADVVQPLAVSGHPNPEPIIERWMAERRARFEAIAESLAQAEAEQQALAATFAPPVAGSLPR